MPSGFAPLARPRRMRAAAHSVHGGASSLLRLAQPAAARFPTGSALAEWAHRAAGDGPRAGWRAARRDAASDSRPGPSAHPRRRAGDRRGREAPAS